MAEPTVGKRIVRAKAKIRDAAIPYRVPPPALLSERLPGVIAVLYLVFNEGYAASSGTLVRVDLCEEAIRLARVLVELMPGEPEAVGLLALMLLHHSRRATRVGAAGELIPLEEQDRARWDHAMIDEGLALVDEALGRGPAGPYQVQAAIAALHARAPRPEDTDWAEIAGLYGVLEQMAPTPVVALNRAVAVAMADGPEHGLPLVEELGTELDGYHLFHAARADLLRRLGRQSDAAEAYRRALALATNPTEGAYLKRRLKQLGGSPRSS